MQNDLVKLAYWLGYKQAQEAQQGPFDSRTGGLAPGFAEALATQTAADNPWLTGGVAAGSTYMAGKSFFTDPVKALHKKRLDYISNLQKTTGLRGMYNQAMNFISPERASQLQYYTTPAGNKAVRVMDTGRVANFNKQILAMKSRPWLTRFKRLGKGTAWATAAALALSALAYRNDMI